MPLSLSERAEILDAVSCEATNKAALASDAIVRGTLRRWAKIGAAAIVSASLIGGVSWAMLRPKKTPHPRERATARCMDGTWSYAVNRQGACAGHGGVKVFYKGR